MTERPGLVDRYKRWVRANPGYVQNLDWLLYLTVWNPARTSAGGGPSEVQYEAYHACIGLLSVWHQHLIEEDELPVKKPAAALWMEALEQVETIIELRSMHLEDVGKMSRYAPLIALESVKSCLKMLMWSQYSGHLFLRHPSPEDIAHFEAEQGFQDVLSALERLRARYTTLADCSAAATTDAMGLLSAAAGQLSAASQPLRAAMRPLLQRLGVGQASTSSSPAPPASRLAGTLQGGEVPGMGGVSAEGGGPCIDWSQVPGLDGRGTVQGVAAWEGEAWQRDGVGGGRKCEGEARGVGAGPNVRRSGRRRWEVATAGDRQQGTAEEGQPPQGFGLPLHVFSDERAGMNLIWLGEMLHIWRPVVYVWMLYRYGRRSWRPWWISLAVDLLSSHFSRRGRLLLQRGAAGKGGGPPCAAPGATEHGQAPTSLLSIALIRGLSAHQWSTGEVRELGERRRKLAMYLLRSPFYNIFVKPPTESIQRRTAHMPLVGSCTDYLAGLIDTFTKYYTYTSASS